MLGITKLQAFVLLGVALFNQGKEATADGIQISDLFAFVDELIEVQAVSKTLAEVKAELNDLDPAERQQLIEAVKEKLNVENQKAENLVGHALDLLAVIYAGITELRSVAS